MNTLKYLSICTLLAAPFLTACGRTESENSTPAGIFDNPFKKTSSCAEAPALKPGDSPILLFRTRSYDQMAKLEDNTDSNFGIEVSEEIRRLAFPGTSGTGVVTQRTCSRAFVLQDKTKVYLENERLPGSHLVTKIRAEKYLILSGQLIDGATKQTEITQLNLSTGLRQRLAVEPSSTQGCDAYLDAQPSPSGDFIVLEKLKPTSCGFEEPRWDLTLQLLDAKAQRIGSPFLDNFTGGSLVTWNSETEYQVRDNERTVLLTVPAL